MFWIFSLILLLSLLLASIASFLTVVSTSLVSDTRTALWRRYTCDHCHSPIAWHAIIPIIGYLLVRGRCTSCNYHISSWYPLSELLYIGYAWLIFVVSTQPLYHLILFTIIFMMAVADAQKQWVPDWLQVLLGVLIIWNIWRTSGSIFLIDRLSHGAIVFTLLVALAIFSDGGIGAADIKLLAILTVGFGIVSLNHLIISASFLALLHFGFTAYKNRTTSDAVRLMVGMAFVPYVCLSFPLLLI